MGTKCAQVYGTLTTGFLQKKNIIETDYDANFFAPYKM